MTKHTEIPADILEAARAIVHRYPMVERDQLEMVAQALMQERMTAPAGYTLTKDCAVCGVPGYIRCARRDCPRLLDPLAEIRHPIKTEGAE